MPSWRHFFQKTSEYPNFSKPLTASTLWAIDPAVIPVTSDCPFVPKALGCESIADLLFSLRSLVVHRLCFHDLFTLAWGVNISCGRQTVFPDSNESLWSEAERRLMWSHFIFKRVHRVKDAQRCRDSEGQPVRSGSESKVHRVLRVRDIDSGSNFDSPTSHPSHTLTQSTFTAAWAHYARVRFSAWRL